MIIKNKRAILTAPIVGATLTFLGTLGGCSAAEPERSPPSAERKPSAETSRAAFAKIMTRLTARGDATKEVPYDYPGSEGWWASGDCAGFYDPDSQTQFYVCSADNVHGIRGGTNDWGYSFWDYFP